MDPLDTPPPSYSLEGAADIGRDVFGVDSVASALDSERDQNFRLDGTDGRSFVLKISNRADDRAAIEMQTLATLHIAAVDPELPVMQPVATIEGEHVIDIDGELVRLFTFLPGRMLKAAEVRTQALRDFGATVARTGKALRGFFHPAGGYEILWDLKNTPDLRPLLSSTRDAGQQKVLATVLDRFDARVGPVLPGLRSQLIHNDLTLSNVLLDDDHRVSGIVDFGDLTHTALICDLAIALVSAMWDTADPLVSAQATIGGYSSVVPIEEAESAILGDLIAARLAALILIANSRVERYPENAEYIMGSVPAAWRLLEHLEAKGWEIFRRPTFEELLERRKQALGPAQAPLSYEHPLYLVRGEGSQMFDHEGNAYLDAYNNVPVVGHSHPKVVRAIAEQSATLNTNTRYLHHSAVELAERLIATMPPGLNTVMFFNSGSEANDIAWRIATSVTGRTGGIVTDFAYHGVTAAIQAVSPEEWVKGERPAHIETIPAPNDFCGPHRREEPGWAESYAEHVDTAVEKLAGRGHDLAILYVDPLFTSDGVFTPPPSYLQEVLRRVRAAGSLFVADEVQCGFGRSGDHLWGFEASGITPDFVTLGKPMGNGHPVAAVITSSEIAERFAAKTDVFSTFGGNPVACRAALAVLDVLEEEALQQNAKTVGQHLRAGLLRLAEKHTAIGDVRGAGLLIGVELVGGETGEPAPEVAKKVVNEMRERGILIGRTGRDGNVLKVRPPLVLTTEEADRICSTLDTCFTVSKI